MCEHECVMVSGREEVCELKCVRVWVCADVGESGRVRLCVGLCVNLSV